MQSLGIRFNQDLRKNDIDPYRGGGKGVLDLSFRRTAMESTPKMKNDTLIELEEERDFLWRKAVSFKAWLNRHEKGE